MSTSLALPRITELGRGSSRLLPEVLARLGVRRPVVVTDAPLLAAGVLSAPLEALICIPTTAGTGSEVTRFCVITDTATNEKMLITGTACVPIAALVDADLTLSMPARVTADTGLDALTHGLEAFISLRRNPHADVFAVSGISRVLDNLRAVYVNPTDVGAREEMLLAALHAGIAFSASSVALIHGMSRPMGAVFHIAHGMANAMLLPSVMTWTLPHAQDRFAELDRLTAGGDGEAVEAVAAAHFHQAVCELAREVGVPTLSERGVDRNRWFEAIPTMTEQAIASGSPANNPGNPQAADIEQLYASLWV